MRRARISDEGPIDNLDDFPGQLRTAVFAQATARLVGFEPSWVAIDFLRGNESLYLAQMGLHRHD